MLDTILKIVFIFIVLLCIYLVYNTNHKVKTLKKRYDYLLRGRGDCNLEELLTQHNDDLEKLKKYFISLDRQSKDIKLRVNTIDDAKNNEFYSKIGLVENKVNDRISEVENNLIANFRELDRFAKTSVFSLEKNFSTRLEDEKRNLSSQIRNIDKDFSKRLVEQRGNIGEELINFQKTLVDIQKKLKENYESCTEEQKNLFEQLNSSINSVNNNLKISLTSLEAITNKKINSLSEQHDVDVQALKDLFEQLKATTTNNLEENSNNLRSLITKNTKLLEERISLTIQKVYLHRYNAFEEIGGEHSYSAVLLDELNNGIIFTSIYSRNGSSTFSKQVVSGKCLTPISPEESEALKRAIQK